jgi:hypothetical protein
MKAVLTAGVATFVTLAALINSYPQVLQRLEELQQTHHRHLPTLENAVRVATNALWQRKSLAPCGTPDGSDRSRGERGTRAAQFPGRNRYDARQPMSQLYRRDAERAIRSDCSRRFKALSGSRQSTPQVFLKRQARLVKKMTAAAGADALTGAAAPTLTS